MLKKQCCMTWITQREYASHCQNFTVLSWRRQWLPTSTLAWKIPWMEEPGRLQSMGSRRVGEDWATSLSLFRFMHWRRKWHPLQCSCLENPKDGGAWWAAVCGVTQSRTRLKRLSTEHREEESGFFYLGRLVFSSVQFSRSVVSDSLRPHESQHASPPCPSPTPRVYSDSCPSSRWCHPAVSSSVVPFSSCPQWLVLVKSREDFPHYQIFPKMVSNDSFFFLLHLKQTFLCMF